MLCICAMAQYQMPKMPENVVYSARGGYNAGDFDGRSANFSPTFFIYPDKALDQAGAKSLVDELFSSETMEYLHASVLVINPVDKKYDARKDFESFVNVYNSTLGSGNLKVIAFGEGATFVNTKLAPEAAGCLSGILTVGGKAAKSLKGDYPGVPVYVAGKTAKSVAAGYEKINAAKKDVEPLLQIVVNPQQMSNSELFADAWAKVLGKAYRFNNYKHTQYQGNKYDQYGVNELEPFVEYEPMGIVRNVVVQKQGGAEALPTLWYEYWPEGLMDSSKVPAGSVPVMVLLHGNTNDPRTQAETSGFIELAAKERFFVVEMEWQGSKDAAAMGYDGVESTLFQLFAKYPQLDRSRVYAEGLSAGSMTATALGVRKPWIFTAVGGHSGGVFGGRGAFGGNYESFINAAKQMRNKIEMPYFSIGGTADNVVPWVFPDKWEGNGYFNAWVIYQTLNGLEVMDKLDFNIDPVFGMKMENRHAVVTEKGDHLTMEIGDLTKAGVPLVRCCAVMDYGHWNFKPTAEQMWDYFKMFSRDPETKELIYHGKAD